MFWCGLSVGIFSIVVVCIIACGIAKFGRKRLVEACEKAYLEGFKAGLHIKLNHIKNNVTLNANGEFGHQLRKEE